MSGIGKLRPNKVLKRKSDTPLPLDMNLVRRPRGRPRKLPQPSSLVVQDDKSSKSIVIRLCKRKKRTKIPKGPKLSFLEQLPLELLERIFVDSMNISLPFCSRHLLTQISRDLLKYELTLNILGRRKHEMTGSERGQLIACRFFTWTFILRYTQWAHKQGVSIEGLNSYQSLNTNQNYSIKVYEEHLDRHLESLKDDQGYIPFNHRIVFQEEFPAIGKNFPHLAGLKNVSIPEKILRGPWNDSAIRFLRLLILSWCTLDRIGTSAGEAADRGAMDAIRDGENEILTYYFQTGTVNVVPTKDMLRSAVVDFGCNLSTVYQILSGSDDTLDLLDPEIWAWIDSAQAKGDKRVARLKKMLREKEKDTLDAADYEDLWSRYRLVPQTTT